MRVEGLKRMSRWDLDEAGSLQLRRKGASGRVNITKIGRFENHDVFFRKPMVDERARQSEEGAARVLQATLGFLGFRADTFERIGLHSIDALPRRDPPVCSAELPVGGMSEWVGLLMRSSCPCVISLRIIDRVSAGDVAPGGCAISPTTSGDCVRPISYNEALSTARFPARSRRLIISCNGSCSGLNRFPSPG